MNYMDILQPISDSKLPELKNILKQNYPDNIQVYNFVDSTIQIKKERPNENYVTIYGPEGNFSDGTIFGIINMHCYDILIHTLDKSLKQLEKCLRDTNIIEWDKKPLFCAMNQEYYEMVCRVRKEIGQPVRFDVPSHIWWYPKEKALQFEYSIPEEMFVAPLNESHAIIMNEVWPRKRYRSEKYLAKLLELNGGIGLFHKSDNKLCSWVLKNYFGCLGTLQTAENYKRNGYASLVVKIFSKMIAEQDGYDISGFIINKNYPSQNMFTKLGFEKLTPVTWLAC